MAPREVHPFEMFGGPKGEESSGIADFGPNPVRLSPGVDENVDPMDGYSAGRSVYGRRAIEELDDVPAELAAELAAQADADDVDSPRDHEDPIIDDSGNVSPPA